MQYDWSEPVARVCESCVEPIGKVIDWLEHFDPENLNHWAGIIGSITGVLWIIYQLNKSREITEQAIEEYIATHADRKRRDLDLELDQTLEALSSASVPSDLVRHLRVAALGFRRLVNFAGRMILIARKWHPVTSAMHEFRSGNKTRARHLCFEFGKDLVEKAHVYEKQAEVKRNEALNAFLYAGRIAALEGLPDVTRGAFDEALKVDKENPSAHKVIGQQYLYAGDSASALIEFAEYEKISAQREDQTRLADAFVLQARVHLKIHTDRSRFSVTANTKLLKALRHFRAKADNAKIAECEELRGDNFAPIKANRQAAENSFRVSLESYRLVGDDSGYERSRRKLRLIMAEDPSPHDPWLARRLQAIGDFILRQAMLLRARRRAT